MEYLPERFQELAIHGAITAYKVVSVAHKSAFKCSFHLDSSIRPTSSCRFIRDGVGGGGRRRLLPVHAAKEDSTAQSSNSEVRRTVTEARATRCEQEVSEGAAAAAQSHDSGPAE